MRKIRDEKIKALEKSKDPKGQGSAEKGGRREYQGTTLEDSIKGQHPKDQDNTRAQKTTPKVIARDTWLVAAKRS